MAAAKRAIVLSNTTGGYYMMKKDDRRYGGPDYTWVTNILKPSAAPRQRMPNGHSARIHQGSDGKKYAVYADWSASVVGLPE